MPSLVAVNPCVLFLSDSISNTLNSNSNSNRARFSFPNSKSNAISYSIPKRSIFSLPPNSNFNIADEDSDFELESNEEEFETSELLSCSRDEEEGLEIEVERIGESNSRRRRVRAAIGVNTDLEVVWSVLTDYEGLADFIDGLAVSKLVEKGDNFARLYQVGEQDIALGLKFNAKGVIECYEKDLESSPSGRRRDIEFKMIEGDFRVFDGRWSIEEVATDKSGEEQLFQTTLSYVVELEPKRWLPVRLVEGRICKEVKKNLICIRDEAHRVQRVGT